MITDITDRAAIARVAAAVALAVPRVPAECIAESVNALYAVLGHVQEDLSDTATFLDTFAACTMAVLQHRAMHLGPYGEAWRELSYGEAAQYITAFFDASIVEHRRGKGN